MLSSKTAFPGLLLAALVALTDCSGQAGRAAASKTVLHLAYSTDPDAGLVQLALAQGFLKAEGLNVNATPYAYGKLALAAMLGGEADLSTAAETPLAFAALAGDNVRIAAVIGRADRNAALLASSDSGVKEPRDLVGKKVGVTLGTTGDYFLGCFLVAQGIDVDRVVRVDIQPAAMLDALKSGRVAAVAVWNPALLDIAAALGPKARLMYGSGIYTENFCLAGTEAFVEGHPDEMKAVMRALLRAERFVAKNTDAAFASISALVKRDERSYRGSLELFSYRLGLDQALLLVLEDETRWALKSRPVEARKMPDYLGYLYTDALASVAPERLRLIR
jgi:ABC-type nitrate/sulfonate/bicarbonate transport system substrate-binding protein